ncbi:MAG: caspase family protein [Treponema sp.]|nr:caspase family protein [Treponema sp.]
MKKTLFILFTFLAAFRLFAATEDTDFSAGVDRYAIYIGCNDGGKERDRLLYAGSDAQNFQKIMAEIGGVQDSNSFILIDPSKDKIDDTLDKITTKINKNKSNAKRSEFIFYYSGHSDENSLLLGEAAYDYSSLKHKITEIPSDIHIVILDSCYSGNFIRTKGGQKKKPFLMDDSSVVKGHAYLSSSSAREFSQESDDIESSYFTNAMITGLRGAADTSGDNKVTLNELYSYAFNETLSKTEYSKAGPQHPNYNITLVGSGDLILSDISNADAMLSLSKEAKGTFIIRDSNGKLISEINKTAGLPILMALPVGTYTAVCINDLTTLQGTFTLAKNGVYMLDQNNLAVIQQKDNTLKGGLSLNDEDTEDDASEASDDTFTLGDPFHLYFVPGMPMIRFTPDCSLISLGMIGTTDRCVLGFQASGVMNINSGKLIGFQGAGVFNIVNSNVVGAQAAGVFNIVNGDILGGQTGGVFNIARKIEGIQVAGLFNIAKSGFGVQVAGGFNIANAEQAFGVQVAGGFNRNKNITGVQVAGGFNTVSELNGIQIAGGINVASKVNGLQLGVINVTGNINGFQLGVINVAKENNGVAIGVLNFIGNGMHHGGIIWNFTDGTTDIFYQSGTKNVFVTVGVSAQKDFFKEWKSYQCILYAGLGTEFRFEQAHSSIDVELLWKSVMDTYYGTYVELPEDSSTEDIGESHSKNYNFIPAMRVTYNWLAGKHLEVSIGANTDVHLFGINDYSFRDTAHNEKLSWQLAPEQIELCNSFFVGFKVK